MILSILLFSNYSFAVDGSIVGRFCFLVWFFFQNQRKKHDGAKEKIKTRKYCSSLLGKEYFILSQNQMQFQEFEKKHKTFPKQNCCPSHCPLDHPELSLSSFWRKETKKPFPTRF